MKDVGYVSHIKKYAIYDGPGIRTTVFLMGCPLSCRWCHNPESQLALNQTDKLSQYETTSEAVLHAIRQDIVFYDESGGGATFSGGEPLTQIDFLATLLEACQLDGVHTAVDTCGYVRFQHFERILDKVDLFLYDLKIMDAIEHKDYTGAPNTFIHDNLTRLSRKGANIHIRVPLIPGITDTESNLKDMARFLSTLDDIRHIDLLPYNPLGVSKYRRLGGSNRLDGLQDQSKEELERMSKLFESFGFDAYIGGGS